MNTSLYKNISRRGFLQNTARMCCQAGVACFMLGPAGAIAASNKPGAASASGKSGVTAASNEPGSAAASKKSGIDPGFEPGYLELHRTGELKERAETLWSIMENCRICPRQCRANRHEGETGFCRSPGTELHISSAMPHFGEERPLVGSGGSGTIFLTHCSLRCIFCQNWEISHLGRGSERSIDEFAGMMLQLQNMGCHNINLVTPTHYPAFILKALDIAAGNGLRLPIVYNTCGWERLETLSLLDGVVDIYLPDFKFWDTELSERLTGEAEAYPEITKKSILEMHRQVGVAKPDENGIMHRGLMVRHLVMPNDKGGSVEIMEWIAENLPKDTYVNIMAQYTPHHKAFDYPAIARRINVGEYREVVERARELGLTNLDVQGYRWLRD